MNNTMVSLVAIDPSTGAQLRDATSDESAAYLTQPARHACFRKAVRVGDVLIDEASAPGARVDQGGWAWL